MSALSTCPVCHGRGFHVLQYPLVNCAYCRGTGVSPIGGRYYCLACQGKGVHHHPNSQQKCPECKGSGVTKGGSGFYCSTCHGSGLKKR
jgi:DnaJ-class molecular chaperone